MTTTNTTSSSPAAGDRVPQWARGDLGPHSHRKLAELRRQSPLLKSPDPGTWAVTRHGDVSALLRDRRLGHAMPRDYIEYQFGDGPSADFQQNALINRDPPEHTRLRTLMGKAFTAPLMRALRDHIGDLVDDLLVPLLDRGSFDIVDGLAFPLPSLVICELLGIDPADRDHVRARTATLVSGDRAARDASTKWLREYMGAVLAQRVPDAEGDLFQRMLAAEEGGDALTHEEIVDNALLLFVAGFETTRNLIANGTAALLRFPAECDRLLGNPDLAASAVEEFLRFDGPVPLVQRITGEPMEIAGRVIKERRVVLLLLASANHDETVFADPARLDITRTPNPHVAFAGGIHHCLGAQLARVEGQVVFEHLAASVRSLDAAGQPERQPGFLRGFAHLPVRATPR